MCVCVCVCVLYFGFNVSKCKILHIGKNDPLHLHYMDYQWTKTLPVTEFRI